MYLEVTLIKPCTFSRFLKGRHNICQLLFLSLHSYPVFSTAYSGSLPPWLSPLPLFPSRANKALGSAFVAIQFLYCTTTPVLKHHFNLRRIKTACSPFVPLPSAQWHQGACQFHFFLNWEVALTDHVRMTQWSCVQNTPAPFSLQELETQSCAIKLPVWKLYACFKWSVNADQQDNERM